jgi:group I intron endonuclease
MAICKALLKYGYSNFSFEILEYCDKSIVLQKEQHYLDLLAPEYYILKTAGNSLGYKHSEVIKQKMSEINLGKIFSEETRKKKSVNL